MSKINATTTIHLYTRPRFCSLHPTIEDALAVRRVVLALLGEENGLDLHTVSFIPAVTLTSSGGFSPHFFARSQRSRRVIPTQGPYLDVMSKTLRMSGEQGQRVCDRRMSNVR